MQDVLKVGNVSAKRGEKRCGPATWVELRDGSRVNLPVILINGQREGPKVVINCATHPTELVGYASIQIVTRKLDPRKLAGSVVAFPISNPLGMQWGEYVSPHDYVNMYVAYPGSKVGSITSRLANFIWRTPQKAPIW
jgi:predicted deacylase